MKCDAKKLNSPEGGFTCSILGDTVGADWLWDKSPYKEKIKESPECDANFIRKKGLFGEKCIFSCWIMGNFKVSSNAIDLETKIKNK